MTAFDLPGHGQSADWDGHGDYGRRTAEVAATFYTEPLHLIGHSFGAVTALRLALAAPEGVRSLTLIEPVLFAAARGHPEWGIMTPVMHRSGPRLLRATAKARPVRSWPCGVSGQAGTIWLNEREHRHWPAFT
jgi:pimeloyl-ACP methyl ester carboxylesterase